MADRVIDLLDGDFYVNDPYPTYAWMRTHAPAYWDGINELWGITRYDDVVRIEKDKERFISSDQEKGGYRPNLPADAALIGLDDPVHTKRRNLVSRRFTPRAASQWEDHVRAVVNALLDDMVAQGGECEIVETLAAPLPAMMIGKLLGFDEDRWRDLKRWSETTIALGGGPRYLTEEGITAAFEFAAASAELFEAKRGCPADDVMTVWTQAEVDGDPLTLDQVIPDCLLLLDGGAETTRTVIGRTILNFIANPDQWAAFRAGADAAIATEEFIRYVTPVHNMCRVATADVELAGETIRAGQQVVLMYPAANRDPDHFDDPESFVITRHPNPHLAFGFGTHFCLGASLARLEIRVFFEELRRRVTGFRLVEGTTPVDLPNAFVYGLTEARVAFDLA
jgi:cytochrome P450 family 142 subfamily A polypeptide 1